MTWAVFGADAPRFVLPSGGLLIEGQRTNSIPNPRWEGTVPGTPGTAPTNVNIDGAASGITVQIVGTGVESGLSFMDVRYFGTATAQTDRSIRLSGNAGNAVPAAVGQSWTVSIFNRVVAGSLTGVTARLAILEMDSTPAQIAASDIFYTPQVGGTLATSRAAATRTFNQAAAAFVVALNTFRFANGATVDVTFRVAAPQLELAPFASTPILPPIGTPGASTRGTDIVTAPLSSLGIGSNGACTVLWKGAFDATNIGMQQTIASVSDATDANRYDVRLNTDGVPQFLRVAASVASTSSFGGSPPTLGSVLRAGICVDGAGRLAAVVSGYNGGAALAITGGPTSGLTTLHCGSSTSGNRPLWGAVERLQVLPRVVSDAELAALVAAF